MRGGGFDPPPVDFSPSNTDYLSEAIRTQPGMEVLELQAATIFGLPLMVFWHIQAGLTSLKIPLTI